MSALGHNGPLNRWLWAHNCFYQIGGVGTVDLNNRRYSVLRSIASNGTLTIGQQHHA